MGIVIACANQKGGVSKTTTISALASGLSLLHKKKVLAIDLDGQMNLTKAVCAQGEGVASSLHIMSLKDGKPMASTKEAIQHLQNFDFIPGNQHLFEADAIFEKERVEAENNFITVQKHTKLREALKDIKKEYDYILLDCPPNLGIILTNALIAADKVIIPIRVGVFSLDALNEIQKSITTIKKNINPNLVVDGILITQTQSRTLISKGSLKSAQNLAKAFNTKVYETKIRFAEKDIEEAYASKKSLFEYAPKANVTKDYSDFIEELMKGTK